MSLGGFVTGRAPWTLQGADVNLGVAQLPAGSLMAHALGKLVGEAQVHLAPDPASLLRQCQGRWVLGGAVSVLSRCELALSSLGTGPLSPSLTP